MKQREDAPGGLATEAYTAVEGFYQQEALRYRRALIRVERRLPPEAIISNWPANRRQAMRVLRGIVTEALDAGDEAAG